jgi:hypothetical protein
LLLCILAAFQNRLTAGQAINSSTNTTSSSNSTSNSNSSSGPQEAWRRCPHPTSVSLHSLNSDTLDVLRDYEDERARADAAPAYKCLYPTVDAVHRLAPLCGAPRWLNDVLAGKQHTACMHIDNVYTICNRSACTSIMKAYYCLLRMTVWMLRERCSNVLQLQQATIGKYSKHIA